jgi:hypothetical protein
MIKAKSGLGPLNEEERLWFGAMTMSAFRRIETVHIHETLGAIESKPFPAPRDLDEAYDLVVVGWGISGLAAAQYYRKRFGDDARILILVNHDDFGDHAKRNEFHQGGQMRFALGGTHNLEHWKFSDTEYFKLKIQQSSLPDKDSMFDVAA